MIKSKYLSFFCFCSIGLVLAIFFTCLSDSTPSKSTAFEKITPEYAEKLFGTEIISIEILADDTTWKNMLENASSKEYIMADVNVNGTLFKNVGIRPKGNSSLQQVAQMSDSERYSFRLQFDKYIDGQTCFGLDSFVVNNMIGDNSYLKEYVSYDLMKEIGVDCPYFGFANLKRNGEAIGFYLTVETYGDSYEERLSGDTDAMLYNVKSMEMGNQGKMEKNMPQGGMEQKEMLEGEITEGQMSKDQTSRENREKIGSRSMGKSGGSLEYTDDNSSSYSSIFDNVVGKGTEDSYQKVIAAIKALSEDRDLESYFDIDQILRYLAAHTIVVNLDSYSSNMAQNYYIYEKNGKLTILPWDYNLAFGGFQSSDLTSVINFPIDTPVRGVEMSSRPLLNVLFSNADYLNRYHSYLQELIDHYFSNNAFEQKIEELNYIIQDYVKQDPTAFCSFEEYQKAVSAFSVLGILRAESVEGQLNGSIPSTTEGQSQNSEALITTDLITLSDLGTMGSGREEGKNGEHTTKRPKEMPAAAFDRNEKNSPVSQTQNTSWCLFLCLACILLFGIVLAKRVRRTY